MYPLSFVIGGVLPYLAAIIFAVGITCRFRAWLLPPQPTKITLFPAPTGSTWAAVVAEAVMWPSLFRGDRQLWFISWLFHCVMALVLAGHLRVFSGAADTLLLALSMAPGTIDKLSALSGGAAGILLLVMVTLLLVRRIAVRRMREISGVGDYFALLLLLCICVTGGMMRLSPSFDLSSARLWARSLVTLSPVIPECPLFTFHLLSVELFISFIPFSKMMHMDGIFFNHAVLRRS